MLEKQLWSVCVEGGGGGGEGDNKVLAVSMYTHV